jgi:adenylate cyclase
MSAPTGTPDEHEESPTDVESAAESTARTTGPELMSAILKEVAVGLAVADPLTWEIDFENAAFFGWFPPDPTADDSLADRIPGFDIEKASQRLKRERPYRLETEVGSGARAATIEIELRLRDLDASSRVIVECTDVSKRKEAEHMLDSYARMAEQNTRDVQREKERAEKLLLNIMPRAVFEEMKDFGSVAPQRFDETTILMLDFVGFTDMAVSREPGTLVSELNDIFSAFDRIVELFGCERMKTIGDAYMAVAGLPEPSEDHADAIARVALRMRRYLEKRNASHPEPWIARMGAHTGSVVGSIVGVQKYVYDIFGPGVNLSSRLEALAEPMQIVLSKETFSRVGHQFITTDLGEYDVKGFGTQRLYSLDAETAIR